MHHALRQSERLSHWVLWTVATCEVIKKVRQRKKVVALIAKQINRDGTFKLLRGDECLHHVKGRRHKLRTVSERPIVVLSGKRSDCLIDGKASPIVFQTL